MIPVCAEHVTIFAFTGMTWCGVCSKISLELKQLQGSQGKDFHFAQIDDADPDSQAAFASFGITGVPTIILFDPKQSKFFKYQGERTAEALTVCALTHECIGLPVDKHPPFTLVHHPSLPKEEEQQSPAILTRLQLCNKDLTLLAFTGILWCHHCKVAQPNILKLKAANPSHVF